MTVKDVMVKYHKLVSFPWTPRKIKKAGFSPAALCITLGKELQQCEDADTPAAKDIIDMIHKLELLGG